MPVLPIDKAYEFASDNGLGAKAQEIRGLKLEGIASRKANAIRKGYFIQLFEENKIYKKFAEDFWPYGLTPEGEVMRRNYLRLAHGIGSEQLGDDDDVGEIETFDFAAESHLRDFLAKGRNIEQIEPGLRIYNSDEKTGIEYAIDNGRGLSL